MFTGCYNSYKEKYGSPEDGYLFPDGEDKQLAALVSSIANKYLRTSPVYIDILKDKSAHDFKYVPYQYGVTYHMLDLELAPALLNEWIPIPDIPTMYTQYIGSDLLKVYFIAPFFLYEKQTSQAEYNMRSHYILHLPKDDRKIIIQGQGGMPSSSIGPGQGYNVCYTCVHYFDNGFKRLYDDLVAYKKEFPEAKIASDMDIVYAATAIRVADSLSPNPINAKPLYFDEAWDLLQEKVGKIPAAK